MAGSTRQSLKNTKDPLATKLSGVDNLEVATVPSKKRKKDANKDTGEAVVSLNKRNKKGKETHQESSTKEVQEENLRVDTRTSRDQLLQLLKHSIRSKNRRSSDLPVAVKSNPGTSSQQDSQVNAEESANSGKPPVQTQEVDYRRFEHTELVQMLREVGLDTTGWGKEELIQSCEIYKDLITLPQSTLPDPVQSGSASTPHRVRFKGSSFDFQVTPGGVSKVKDPPCPPRKETSTSVIPSLQHGTLLYPRPRPTVLDSSPTKRNKGKARAHVESDDDYLPEIEEDHEDHPDHPDPHEQERCSVQEEVSGGTQDQADGFKSNKAHEFHGSSEDFKGLKQMLIVTNWKIDTLTDDVKTLSQVVKTLVDRESLHGSVHAKTPGGRTSSRVRFHIELMIGQKSPNSPLHHGATSDNQEGWKFDMNLDSVEVNLNDDSYDSTLVDPQFPYPDGPGHQNATPQQLSITWKLMNAAGVSSFRPDFGESATSTSNRWLWNLAQKIFMKMVAYGVYTGISLDPKNVEFIKGCFDKHIQTLKKRYRQEQWNEERKKRSAMENKRSSRMSRVKKARTETVLSEEYLWPLLPLVKLTTSDDETDTEPALDTTPSKGKPIIVRKTKWQSAELQEIWVRIDERKSKVELSIPGSSGSPNRAGRPSRPRLRRENAPKSKVETPVGLPIDCYLDSYVEGLNSLEKLALEINPVPICQNMLNCLNKLGW